MMHRRQIPVWEIFYYDERERHIALDQLMGIPTQEDMQKVADDNGLDVKYLQYFETHTYI